MTKQKLVVKVQRLSGSDSDDLKNPSVTVRMRLGSAAQSVKMSPLGLLPETLQFELSDVRERMHFEVLRGNKNAAGIKSLTVEEMLKQEELTIQTLEEAVTMVYQAMVVDVRAKERNSSATAKPKLDVARDPAHEEDNEASQHKRPFHKEKTAEKDGEVPREKHKNDAFCPNDKKETKEESECRDLAPHTHRPWFTRVSSIYDVGKRVYSYTTSFPILYRFARLGESTAEYALKKWSGRTLRELDESSVVPILSRLDEKLDGTIHSVLSTLLQSQQYVIETKDVVVENISYAAEQSYMATSHAAGAAMDTAWRAKEYTSSHIFAISSVVYGGVYSASLSIASHVPYLGARLRT